MRKYTFRGKRIDNGVWVYGSLLQSEVDVNELAVNCQIHERFANDHSIKVYDVNPVTVGQSTGLKDSKGAWIYEGDIISGWKKGSNSDRAYTGVIEWQTEQAGWIVRCQKFIIEILSLAMHGGENGTHLSSFEVIGNLYSNPELVNRK